MDAKYMFINSIRRLFLKKNTKFLDEDKSNEFYKGILIDNIGCNRNI